MRHMKIGLDTYSLSQLNLDPIAQLDWIHRYGFAGAQFGRLPNTLQEMLEIRRHADHLGLYSHISISSPNPYKRGPRDHEARIQFIAGEIERAAECGWHQLHGFLGGPEDRYKSDVKWDRQVAEATRILQGLAPVLRSNASCLNLEPHGDATTFELVRLVEQVGEDVLGICLDTANVLLFGEDPVAAARRVAPYTHLTHAKDAILFFCDEGLRRQVRPPGKGLVDWAAIFQILSRYEPELPVSIEIHPWFFDVEIFDPGWHEDQKDLSRAELSQVVRWTSRCMQRIQAGEWEQPEAYEQTPFVESLVDRLQFGRSFLGAVLEQV